MTYLLPVQKHVLVSWVLVQVWQDSVENRALPSKPDEKLGYHTRRKPSNPGTYATKIAPSANEAQMKAALTRCVHKQQDHI